MSDMKLIEIHKRNDFVVEFILKLLKFKNYTLLQTSFSYSDYPTWPYIQIMMGNGKILGFFCYAWKLGFDFDILGRTWRNFDVD